jgi:glutaredoxin
MFCQHTKEFLSKHGVNFDDRNIVADPQALEELRKLHLMTTPVIVVGEAVIVGFDEEKLKHALGI